MRITLEDVPCPCHLSRDLHLRVADGDTGAVETLHFTDRGSWPLTTEQRERLTQAMHVLYECCTVMGIKTILEED